ncbi:MAG: hypothetical protein LBI82_11215 [Dysgonamonadaceae bacterium]|nr:hypothetical protein [Dysgonamonadaceae bacterium]
MNETDQIFRHFFIMGIATKKTVFICVICLIIIHSKTYSQVTPSIYAGCGLGTNIGGIVGIGSEVKYKMISFNVAIGSTLGGGGLLDIATHSDIGPNLRLDYDFGVKLYSKVGVFLGLNYGLIGAEEYTTESGLLLFEKTHGFSFTLGYRHSIYKNFYGLGFIGLTSNKKENTLNIFGDKSFFPRLGLIVGYEFKTINK